MHPYKQSCYDIHNNIQKAKKKYKIGIGQREKKKHKKLEKKTSQKFIPFLALTHAFTLKNV